MRPSPHAVTAVVDGTVTVLTPDMRFLQLDEVGALIWNEVSAGTSMDGIVAAIVDAYDVDDATARADAVRFMGYLRDEGLVEDE